MIEAKVAVIVGVGSGLGSAVAHRFAHEGFAVGLMARQEDKLVEIQQEIEANSGKAMSIGVDVTNVASMKSGFAQVHSQLGAPSVLVYNAGAFKIAGILEITPEQFETNWKVNCFGALIAAQEVLPPMVEKGHGTILLTGATAAIKGSARFAGLAVGKFGLRALAQSMAREFGPQGIHVAHIIIDGIINTPRVQAMALQREAHTLSKEAIAETYWQLYKQDATAWTLELDLRPAVERF